MEISMIFQARNYKIQVLADINYHQYGIIINEICHYLSKVIST